MPPWCLGHRHMIDTSSSTSQRCYFSQLPHALLLRSDRQKRAFVSVCRHKFDFRPLVNLSHNTDQSSRLWQLGVVKLARPDGEPSPPSSKATPLSLDSMMALEPSMQVCLIGWVHKIMQSSCFWTANNC